MKVRARGAFYIGEYPNTLLHISRSDCRSMPTSHMMHQAHTCICFLVVVRPFLSFFVCLVSVCLPLSVSLILDIFMDGYVQTGAS